MSLLRAKGKVAPLVHILATCSENEIQRLFWITSSQPWVGDLFPANTGKRWLMKKKKSHSKDSFVMQKENICHFNMLKKSIVIH